MVCSYAEEQAQPTAAVLATRPPVHPATKKRSRKKSPHEIHATFTRAQQDSRLYNLKLDINDLKQQVRELAMHRELLLARSFIPRPNSDASVLRTVGRYFHGFTPGYRGLLEHAEQDAFVRSIVDEDFSLGLTGLGVDMLMEQWRRYTALFHVRETYLHSAEIITSMDDDSTFVLAKCAMDFRGVLTRAAVDMIFPNVQHDPALLLQALGREIAIPMLFHLYFNEDGRLVRHDAVADFFGAIGEALGGDICTAMRFTSDALVGQEAMLGPLSPVCAPESPMIDIVPLKKPRRVSSPNAAEDEIPFAEAEDEWAGQPSVVSPCTDDGTWDSDQVEVFDQGGCAWVDGSCDKSSSSNDSHRRLSVSFLLS